MTLHELAVKLNTMYETDPVTYHVSSKTMVHLFGIIYASEMEKAGIKVPELIAETRIINETFPKHYGTEVYNGIRLSQFVELKKPNADKF